MAKNVTFTPASIDALTNGKLRDPRTPGLMIEVLASGRKIWKYERRLIAVGAYVRLTLGRFKVDFETAEAMMNHVRSGMERIYDGYELEEEKAAWFLKWEQEIAAIAGRAGVAEPLGIPNRNTSKGGGEYSIAFAFRMHPRQSGTFTPTPARTGW